MAKTGIVEYDRLPSSLGLIDIDAMRAAFSNLEDAGITERFLRRLGMKGIAYRLQRRRLKARKEVETKLQALVIYDALKHAKSEHREEIKIYQCRLCDVPKKCIHIIVPGTQRPDDFWKPSSCAYKGDDLVPEWKEVPLSKVLSLVFGRIINEI